ncbi:MAG: prolipoprotein diacylglyceryl transferase [Candidatus Dadabacteria bacterium]|nr:prolipoprotein diacylglyceryl transferase [Candidatus Dadabacteria bacterium]MYA48680.1 prolipoprotein diacylglyceryl transferase [Candidatus Dadabacteria bacterium]MYF48253.1 prolipoprotein diacylglyceryl transferase [Candidatus Dadabacteria bacterium]MYG82834.1 prolipoprotein diacylglyceryl transferase [Candidatus Dadabacteria bacterium]MYK48691.1 prolipoprotein diacylglyceryl transferase [Candidatus Dadabacteria bacterium]
MFPELLRIGDFHITSFGAMVAVSFLVAFWVSGMEFERKGISKRLHEHIFLASILGGILGAKFLFLIENVPLSDLLSYPKHYLLLRGGLTFYGGLFLALFAAFVVTKKHKESFWKVLDATAPALAIAYATGRVGCLLVGDDYGIPSTLPWAMPFPKGSPPTLEAVHPTQIYETIVMSLVFLALWKIRKKDRSVGWLASIYLVLAGLERFSVEFIRNTTESPISGLSVAQIMAFFLILIGVLKYMSIRKRGEAS